MARTTTNKLHNISKYDCRNKCVFSFRRNTLSDEADVMSSGRSTCMSTKYREIALREIGVNYGQRTNDTYCWRRKQTKKQNK